MGILEVDSLTLEERQFGPVSLEFPQGEMTMLCGLSGSGKSTFCQLLCSRREPDEGKVQLRDGGVVGYVSHDFENQLLGATAREELELGLREPPSEKVSTALTELRAELEERLSCDPHELAPADQQILLLCSLVNCGARFLVLDESLSYLDPAQWRQFLSVLRRLTKAGISTLLVSHQRACLEEVDRVIALQGGKVIFDGLTEQFSSELKLRAGLETSEYHRSTPGQTLMTGPETERVMLKFGESRPLRLLPGEALVVGGLARSGKSRCLEGLFGLRDDPSWRAVTEDCPACFLRQHVAPSFWRRTVEKEWGASLGALRTIPEILETQLRAEIPDTWLEKNPQHLSNGQLRYFGALCLLAQYPGLLFLEQPFLGLDGLLRRRLFEMLGLYLENGGRLILSTNTPETASLMGDKVVWLEKGRVHYLGSADESWHSTAEELKGSWAS